MAASLVPPMLDEGSVGNLIATLQRSLYPRPSQGFTVRLGILWALTGALILLALSYLLLHALRSKERPRWKSLWLVRVVERPGGSYVVMNCLPVWALSAVAYGVYELLYTGLFWRVYVLQRPQNVMNGFRSFDGPALFVCGWTISWSGLQSFLLATESDAFYLPSARLANALFVGGGLFLLVLNLGFAVATTVLADKIIQRYEDLLGALQALNERLAGRVPIPEDFLPIQAPAEAFARAAYNTRILLVVQFSVVAISPALISAVNLGGLALARKLRAQIDDSVELLVQTDMHIADLPSHQEEMPRSVAVQIPLVPSTSAVFDADREAEDSTELYKTSLAPGEFIAWRDRRSALSKFAGSGDRQRSLLTFSEVKRLATQTDAVGRTTASHLQAKKVLALQKATRDLQINTSIITFISTCLLGLGIWTVWCAVNDKLVNGDFAYVEGTAMTPQWLFSVIVFAGFLGLHYNALVIDQRPLSTTDNPTAANPAGVSPGTTCASFARDLFHPGSAKRKMRKAEAQLSGASEAAGPPRTLAPTSALHPQDVDIPMSRRGSTQSPAGPAERSWYTTGLGRRPKSSTGAAIMVTVEQEQVCDGETCARWYAQQEDEDNVAPDQRV